MKSSDEEGADHFPLRFKEYRDRELNYSRLGSPAESPPKPPHPGCNLFDNDGVRWVFWNRQDDNPYRTLPNDHPKVRLNIRYALHKSIMCLGLRQCLVQFWAPTKTAEGRTLLTTQFQPFAIGATKITSSRHRLCEYRMGMCWEYNSFYADAESREEQLGLPGRVFLNQLPESTPAVEYYSLKEYPQCDLALRCGIKGSWAVPVFEHSGHTCVGVLEIVCELNGPQGWYDEEFLGSMYDIFQELGLRCFDGYKHYKMQYGDENKVRTAAFQELKMVYELVCKIHNLPLALTWVSCRSCNDLLQSQLQFLVLGYYGKVNWDEDFYKNLNVFIKASKVCHLRKGRVTGRILPFCNLVYCADVKQFSIAEFPLVPYARFCSLGGRFTMCLHSSDTGDELYVLEFFLPASNKNKENILTRLSLILGTMEEYFTTFKLASGQGLGEALSVEVIDFQNGQKSYSSERIQATRSIPGRGVMLQQGQQDHPSMDAINNEMYVTSEAQNYNLPSIDSLQNGKVTMQLGSSDQRSMDPSNNGHNVVTAERNILGKRKMEDREHKKAGVRIEIPIEEILKCSNMNRKDAAAAVNVGISTFKRVCREYGIVRWPPRYVKQVESFPPSRRYVKQVQPFPPSSPPSPPRSPPSFLLYPPSPPYFPLLPPSSPPHLPLHIPSLPTYFPPSPTSFLLSAQHFPPLPFEKKGPTSQLNFDLDLNEASGSVANTKTGFQDADMVTIRAKYENNIIKFWLSLSSKLVELQQEVAKRLNLMAGTYYIRYKDEEDCEDLLTLIACDEDLQDCIQYFRSLVNTPIVLQLEPK